MQSNYYVLRQCAVPFIPDWKHSAHFFKEQQGRKLIALPVLQVASDFPCDVGSDVVSLRKEMDEANLAVDLSFVEEDWTDKVNLISFGAKWS
jgi:hypothetical protein